MTAPQPGVFGRIEALERIPLLSCSAVSFIVANAFDLGSRPVNC